MILAVGSVAEARARLDTLAADDPLWRLQAGVLAYLSGDFDACCAHMLTALRRAPRLAWNTIVREASYQYTRAVRECGCVAEAAALLDALYDADPTMTTVSIHDPLDNADALALRRQRVAEKLPSAAVITLTKSGSVSVGAILASGFRLPTVTYAMVTEAVVPSWAWDFSRGGGCYVTHLRPTPEAVEQLEMAGIHRIFVHVRDPRQAYLSWLHYAPGLWGAGEAAAPADRFDAEFGWYLDAVDWIDGWVKAGPRLGIHFSTFEAFVADRDGFIDRMVAAYGGDPRYFDRAAATTRYAGTDYHLRRGETDEWRRVLTPDQIARLNAALPRRLADRFGWPAA